MATYVVGDIQGCLPALKCLMRQVSFNYDRDTFWSVGDIVNGLIAPWDKGQQPRRHDYLVKK